MVPHSPVFEGRVLSTGDVDGKVRSSELQPFGVEFALGTEAVVKRGLDAFLEELAAAADRQRSQLTSYFLNTVHDITSEVGNAIDAEGQQLTQDLYLKFIGTPDWDFHDSGEPDLSSIVIVLDPALSALVEKHLPEWGQDPLFREKMATLVTQKREEWCDRESHRRLVD